jgi:hypothetical protein
MYEKKGETQIESSRFTDILQKKADLNECLRKSLQGCFGNVKDIFVRKLRALIDKLKIEIGCGSISFIQEFDVARSIYANSSQFYRTSDMPQLLVRQESSMGDLATEFFKRIGQLL